MKFFNSDKVPSVAPLSRQEALACVVVVNQSVHFSRTQEGDIVVEYPIAMRPLFKSLLLRFQKNLEAPTKKLQLDQMGSIVWQMIDGKNTVKAIIESFASTQNITLQESEISVTAFLAELGKRGIIAFA